MNIDIQSDNTNTENVNSMHPSNGQDYSEFRIPNSEFKSVSNSEFSAESRIELTYEQKQDIGLKYILDLLEPASPYGAKLLKLSRFYKSGEKAELERELDNISVMLSALETEPDIVNSIRHSLSALKDISGSIKNCAAGALTEIELFELTAFLLRLKELIPMAESLTGYGEMEGAHFEQVEGPLSILDPKAGGRLSFFVEDSRTEELSRLRREKRALEEKLRSQDADRDSIMAERLAITSCEEQELLSIYAIMSDSLRPMLPILETNIRAAGKLDFAISKALLARRFAGSRPDMGGESLLLDEAVNPEIAEALERDGRGFTPITVEMPLGVTILTGANMGGKSVAIKTIALNIALAQMGYFVLCKKAKIPVFDRIELINRDFSSVAGGLSSFGGEIIRFNEAVTGLREGGISFIAMDEFARGTNSEEGAAIVRSVVKFLNAKNAVTVLATHYDGAAEFASRRYQARGLRSLRDESPLDFLPARDSGADRMSIIVAEHMDYGFTRVDKDADYPRDAMLICRLLGMDEEILSEIELLNSKEALI